MRKHKKPRDQTDMSRDVGVNPLKVQGQICGNDADVK